MRILGRYVFREIVAGSILATVLSTFVIYLRNIGPVFELIVRSGRANIALELIVLSLPPVLIFSIPFGVLVGILVGLGRMSGDNEMIAMRSVGVSTRVVITPVLLFAALATMLSGACAVWLNPLALRAEYKLLNKVAAAQVTANVERGIFQEQFTNDNTVLYVDDVSSDAGPARWRGVFIADLTPPSERKNGLKDQPAGPRITLAREAVAVPDPATGRIHLHLIDESVHDSPVHENAPEADTALQQAPPPERKAKPISEMSTPVLMSYVRASRPGTADAIEAAIELHKRFAFPVSCMLLALVGIPLGASSRRGGRSSGYVWAILLGFFAYYLAYIALTGMARSHSIGPVLASWLPNIAFGVAGLIMVMRMEMPGDRDIIGAIRTLTERWLALLSLKLPGERSLGGQGGFRIVIFRIVDNYVLSGFLFYFVVWICAFVAMTQIYTFFELLGDIVKYHIPMWKAARYHLFLTPQLIYDTLPFGVLLAVLVTFGVMSKNNEVTAFKACGISVRRLGLPVILMSCVLSAAAFAADYSWIPLANQIQDSIHNEIKGRPAQTYLRPERKWVIHGYRVFYFRYFETADNVMVEPWVYEIDPKTFKLVRQITASRARWQPAAGAWIFEQGKAFDLCGVYECRSNSFTATSFPEITETPGDFLKEVRQNQQMNYQVLNSYIQDLSQSGFNTVKLQVQYYKKFTTPLFALTIALISVPFGFLVGSRGAMAGVGVSIALAMTYLGVDKLFEQMGNVGYLPPWMSAWAPDTIFSLAGLYLILRMRS